VGAMGPLDGSLSGRRNLRPKTNPSPNETPRITPKAASTQVWVTSLASDTWSKTLPKPSPQSGWRRSWSGQPESPLCVVCSASQRNPSLGAPADRSIGLSDDTCEVMRVYRLFGHQVVCEPPTFALDR
jgi:hypothetical protein